MMVGHFMEVRKQYQVENNHAMASLDMTNLYTNVPIDNTIKLVEEHLLKLSSLNKVAIN